MVPIAYGIALAGPVSDVSEGESPALLAFFAVVVFVAVVSTAVLASVAMRELEDAVRGASHD